MGVEGGGLWSPVPPTRNPTQRLLASLAEEASALLRDIPEWTCHCVTAQGTPNRLGHFIQTWGTWLPRHMLCGWTHFCFSPHGCRSLQLREQGKEVRRRQGGRSEKSVEEDWITVGSQGVGDSGTDWWESLPGWQGPENCHRWLCWASCLACACRAQAKWEQDILTVTKTPSSISAHLTGKQSRPLDSKSPRPKPYLQCYPVSCFTGHVSYQSFNKHLFEASKCQGWLC